MGEAMSADRNETVLVILPTGRMKHVRQKEALRMIVNGEVGSLEHQTGLTIDTGKHWFYVTARNWAGESDPSNVLMANTNRPGPVLFRIRR